MKKYRLVSFLLSFVLMFSVLVNTNNGCLASNKMFLLDEIPHYYYHYFYQQSEKEIEIGLDDFVIGDCTYNGKVDAADALLALACAVVSKGTFLIRDEPDPDFTLCEFEIYCAIQYRFYTTKQKLGTGALEQSHHHHFENVINNVGLFYMRNAYNLCDVSNDYTVDAVDALLILQYSVGKIDQFPRTDFTGKGNFQFMDWPGDWYPTKYFDLRTTDGEEAYDELAAKFGVTYPDIPPVQTE